MYKAFFKRFLDIVLSLFGIIVLSPVFLIIAVAIVIDDPGPIFLNRNESEKIRNCLRY